MYFVEKPSCPMGRFTCQLHLNRSHTNIPWMLVKDHCMLIIQRDIAMPTEYQSFRIFAFQSFSWCDVVMLLGGPYFANRVNWHLLVKPWLQTTLSPVYVRLHKVIHTIDPINDRKEIFVTTVSILHGCTRSQVIMAYVLVSIYTSCTVATIQRGIFM